MKFLRKKTVRPKLHLKATPLEPVFVSPVGHNTKLSDANFEITIPGVWRQSENADRIVFADETGKRHLFLTKFSVEGKLRLGDLRNVLHDFATQKQHVMTKVSKETAQCSESSVRKFSGEEELMFYAYDPENKVACFTIFRGKGRLVVDFTVYLYGLTNFDPKEYASYQAVLESIKLK